MLYRLYGFSNGDVDLYTRGESQDQAMDRACQSDAFRKGSTIFPLDSIPIHVKDGYSKTHPFDWLNTPMRWLK